MSRVEISDTDPHMMLSGCAPDGSLVLVRCPAGMKLWVSFDDDGSTRDHTSWMADFAIIGWFHAAQQNPGVTDAVEVAHLQLEGAHVDDVEAWWIHPASGTARRCDGGTLLGHVARGIAVQIAEAVAEELIDENPVPVDPAALTPGRETETYDQDPAATAVIDPADVLDGATDPRPAEETSPNPADDVR